MVMGASSVPEGLNNRDFMRAFLSWKARMISLPVVTPRLFLQLPVIFSYLLSAQP